MRKLSIIFLVIGCLYTQATYSQLYDKNWILGDSCVGITFNNDSTIIPFTFQKTNIGSLVTLACISNAHGDLQLFTNGTTVYNMDGDTMDNGTRIIDSLYNQAYNYGQAIPQGALILPKGGSQYYLIYYSVTDQQYSTSFTFLDELFYAVIDMSLNGGKGAVISKQNLLYFGQQGGGRLTACRHANGRDWWLVNHGYRNNAYHVYLVTPNGITGPAIQSIGPAFSGRDAFGQAVFSPDGTKYASANYSNPIVILDFDRCNGIFSNPDSIYVPIDTVSTSPLLIDVGGSNGLCFSPNGRYLYANKLFHLDQYDLQAPKIDSSAIRIFTSPYTSTFYGMDEGYTAPDGSIILSNFQGFNHFFYKIRHPNSQGTGCGFDLTAISLGTRATDVMSNMPHYRLGPLIGSGCDTLHLGVNDIAANKIGVKVFPNPANDFVTLSLMQYHKNAKLHIYDALGKEVYRNESIYLDADIDLRNFSSGIYLIKIFSQDGDVTGRFVKE